MRTGRGYEFEVADGGGERKKKGGRGWILTAFISFLFVLLAKKLCPDVIPFDIFQFWKHNRIWEGLLASWPIFLWGGGITMIVSLLTRNSWWENAQAESRLLQGAVASALAGVLEEMAFRWVIFLAAIVSVQISNFLFFGWLGFGIPQWLHLNFFGPAADLLTFGKMHWLIFGMGWSVGLAALAANMKFQKGHAYLGIFGRVNSWAIGMFLFWIMFNYGLLTGIIVHFAYDMLIFVVRYADSFIERARGG